MRLKQIVKFIQFLLLLFVFACNGDDCPSSINQDDLQGTPQLPKDTATANWMAHLPQLLSSSTLDALFGPAVYPRTLSNNSSMGELAGIATGIAAQNPFALLTLQDGFTAPSLNVAYTNPDPNRGFIGTRRMIAQSPNKGLAATPEKAVLSEDSNKGTVYGMYASIVRSNEYRATYYLCLVLYIVFLGLSYLLGMTTISLEKSIPIIIKVGIISLFTNPALSNSTGMPIGWSAYYSVIVSPSLYAMESFAMHFSSALFEININNIDDGFAPLAIMLQFLLSHSFWLKISTIAFGAFPMGIATFVLMIVSMVIYMIAALFAILSYLTILATLGILFAIGPIFFIFLLFEKTQPYFERWWKQILALMLQQYVLFIVIAVFGFIILKSLQAMLSFDVTCTTIIRLKMIFGIFDQSLFSYYTPTFDDSHSVSLAMHAIFFLMLTTIFASSVDKISSLANNLIEGVTGVGSSMGMVNEAFGKIKGVMQDYSSRVVRNAYGSGETTFKGLFNGYATAKESYEKLSKLADSDKSVFDKLKGAAGIVGSNALSAAKEINPFKDSPQEGNTRLNAMKDAFRRVFPADSKTEVNPADSKTEVNISGANAADSNTVVDVKEVVQKGDTIVDVKEVVQKGDTIVDVKEVVKEVGAPKEAPKINYANAIDNANTGVSGNTVIQTGTGTGSIYNGIQ